MYILLHYSDEDKRNQKCQEAETVSSQNLEDISDEDAAVQVTHSSAGDFKTNLKQRWRLLGQAVFPVSAPALPTAGTHRSELL